MCLVFLIEFLFNSLHLAPFESGDLDRPPASGSPGHGGENELEDELLAKGVGYDLQAPALLDKETLQKVRGADRAAVIDQHAQVRDAGLEVVGELPLQGHHRAAHPRAAVVSPQSLGLRPLHRLADLLRIHRVVLIALHVRLP